MRISDWSSDVCSSDLAEQIEYRLLHVGAMDTHRAATDFDTIEHDVVALRQRRTRIGTQRVGIERLGRGERMVQRDPARSEERRVGKGCVGTGRTRWSPDL